MAQLRQLERLQTKPKGHVAKGEKENSSNASQSGFIQKEGELMKFRGRASCLAGSVFIRAAGSCAQGCCPHSELWPVKRSLGVRGQKTQTLQRHLPAVCAMAGGNSKAEAARENGAFTAQRETTGCKGTNSTFTGLFCNKGQ